jgi:hypothetical protein
VLSVGSWRGGSEVGWVLGGAKRWVERRRLTLTLRLGARRRGIGRASWVQIE